MNILYIAQRLPYPPNRGDRIPTYNHIKHLARRHRVSVAALYQSRDEAQAAATLGETAHTVTAEYQSRRSSWLGSLKALFTGRPISLGYFSNSRLKEKIRETIAAQNIEAVVVFSSSMAQYVEDQNSLIRIMNFCDVDSEKWADLALRAGPFKRWIFAREARLLLGYERKIALAFSASCVVTENEAELFRRRIPGIEPAVVANGVDFDFFGATVRRPSACELAFVGVMDYEPNVEAAVFFARQIMPRLRSRHPSARFNVVGARPSREVKNLAGTENVFVTGFVEDVRDYLATATLVVVPLAVARGIQNKILEAMAAGVPVLATPAAASGFPPEERDLLFIAAREGDAFLETALSLLSEKARLAERAEAARSVIRSRYSWEGRTRVLENLILSAAAYGKTLA